jgi:hypothetical protein
MIGDVTSGTRNLPAAVKYGDATVPELGMLRHQEADSVVAWAIPGGPPGICVTPPWNKQQAKDQTQARRLYDLAIGLAGSDESPPGDRDGGLYAACFRDLDGNKLNALCMG